MSQNKHKCLSGSHCPMVCNTLPGTPHPARTTLLQRNPRLLPVDRDLHPVAQAKLALDVRKVQIRDEEDLRRAVDQRHAEVKVRVGRVGVDPQVPHGRPEDARDQHRGAHDKVVAHDWKKD